MTLIVVVDVNIKLQLRMWSAQPKRFGHPPLQVVSFYQVGKPLKGGWSLYDNIYSI